MREEGEGVGGVAQKESGEAGEDGGTKTMTEHSRQMRELGWSDQRPASREGDKSLAPVDRGLRDASTCR